VTTSYTYGNEDILREVRGTTTLKYVHGPGFDEPLAADDGSTLSYFQPDALGSIVKVTNAAGAVTLTRQYDAWGNLEIAASEPGYAFTGREWDGGARLYYYRTRYYDPSAGRFLGEDPLSVQDRPIEELHPYAYVMNNPVNHVDPLGLSAYEWLPCVVKINHEVTAGHCGNGKNASDDYSCREAHCIANCRISRECFAGGAQAAGMSYVKEVWDWGKKKTWDSNSEGWSTGDQNANRKGRCMGKSPYAQGWTCEELCRGTR
jgi:RHS repeat-associated protein